MCSVAGALCRHSCANTLEDLFLLTERSMERGRDSFGMTQVFPDGATERINDKPRIRALTGRQYSVLANLRGEPAPEWVQEKTEADVQPFTSPSGRWIFTHNGTIANDKELIRTSGEYQSSYWPPTEIDSYAIGVALDQFGFEEAVSSVLIGSFAILAIDTHHPETMYWAANYKPLWVLGSVDGSQYLFGSQQSYFNGMYDELREPGPVELGPYQWGWVNSIGAIYRRSLYPKRVGPKKTLVVCSGGLDSTVAAWHQHRLGDEVTLLHFAMKAKAQGPELRAVHELSQRMYMYPDIAAAHVMVVPMDFFKVNAPSVLTDDSREVNKGGEAGAELATEWVPARNTVFAALAMAIAEAQGFDAVVFGVNLEEGGAFPDNEPEWANKVRQLIPYAMKAYKPLEFLTSVGNLMKHEIVKMGLSDHAPMELSWSCYEGGRHHCGKCGPCFNRKTAFRMNGRVDPVFSQEEVSS
jgi:7-cyano-7-deazaguanine synthase